MIARQPSNSLKHGLRFINMNSGKLVSLGVLLLAIGLGAFAWTYHRSRSDRAVNYWGAQNAVFVRTAPQVALARLVAVRDDQVDASVGRSSEPAARVVMIDDRPWQVLDERDITNAPGLVHLRQALVQNSSFDWSRSEGDASEGSWDYVLRFRSNAHSPEKLLDTAIGITNKRLQCLDGRPPIGLRIADGLETFIAEQFR